MWLFGKKKKVMDERPLSETAPAVAEFLAEEAAATAVKKKKKKSPEVQEQIVNAIKKRRSALEMIPE